MQYDPVLLCFCNSLFPIIFVQDALSLDYCGRIFAAYGILVLLFVLDSMEYPSQYANHNSMYLRVFYISVKTNLYSYADLRTYI
jgi:hypothetical protein